MTLGKWILASLPLLAACPDARMANPPDIASVSVAPDGSVQASGLPAFAPATDLLLVQDPADAVGVSDCVEICGMDVKSGRIQQQWSSGSTSADAPASMPMASLRDVLMSTAFETLRELDRDAAGSEIRFSGQGTVVVFTPESRKLFVHSGSGPPRTVTLPSRQLMCDDDPEAGERNVQVTSVASDVVVWVHPATKLVLLRSVHLGNDHACTRAEWRVLRP